MAGTLFVGFRKEPRERFAKLLGVEPKTIRPTQIGTYPTHHLYIKSLRYLWLSPAGLLAQLQAHRTHKTKFVCLDEGFHFDGSITKAKRKRIRHETIILGKHLETSDIIWNSLNALHIDMKYQKHVNKRNRLPRSTEKIIVDDYKSGMKIRQISFHCEVSEVTVRKVLRKFDLISKPLPKKKQTNFSIFGGKN